MTQIKSYTDIEQSKKLAEILPLESADMHYGEYCVGGENYPIPNCDDDYNGHCCWSLAALLGVFPTFTIDSSDDHYFRVHCYTYFSEWHNNAVDACYEMILKLHEQNLL